ncbi:unnamed protein product [Urochloa decumbens]|uniref:Uncharacterized protein n=1 Tax=Urochloa decumbens TaxID=240449 RepID=A0ABC9BA11_9POAL
MSSQQDQPDVVTSRDNKRKGADEMVKENLKAFYSRGVPLVNVWMALSFFAKMKYHEFGGRWMIAYLSTILRITAATALMLFFDTTDTVTVFILFGLVLVPVIYFFCRMFRPRKVPGFRWLDSKELLNRGFEMSALVVAPSVAGLSGKVLGYVKESSNLTGGHTAVAPECFLFYSAVSGLLVVLFCTVPPSLKYDTDIQSMAKVYIPSMAYIALSFLVVATVVAAQKILQEYVYLVCCPIAIIATFVYLWDAQGSSGRHAKDPPAQRSLNDARQDEASSPAQRSLNDERQYQAKLAKYLFTAGISSILLAIMAIHSSYGIGGSPVSLSWTWKAFVSSAVCSILSHTVRILILAQMTETERYENSRIVWTAVTCAAIAITAVFALLIIWLHPDEVKNIF